MAAAPYDVFSGVPGGIDSRLPSPQEGGTPITGSSGLGPGSKSINSVSPGAATDVPTTSATPDTLGSLLTSATGVLGSLFEQPGSSNSALSGLGPYALLAGYGLTQADKQQQENQRLADELRNAGAPYSAAGQNMLQQQQAGQITPAQQNVADTAKQQGNALLGLPQNALLSDIATNAFSAVKNQTLLPGDQAALDQSTAAAKQRVAQMLAQNGITDSSILTAQYQQIDNQALINKQQLLNGYQASGNSAYDEYTKTTKEGQALVLQGQQYVANSLEQNLQDSLQLGQFGVGPLQQAIQLQIQSDTQLQQSLSQLMSGLAQAYSMALWGGKQGAAGGSGAGGGGAAGGGNSASSLANQARKLLGGGSGGISTGLDLGSVSNPGLYGDPGAPFTAGDFFNQGASNPGLTGDPGAPFSSGDFFNDGSTSGWGSDLFELGGGFSGAGGPAATTSTAIEQLPEWGVGALPDAGAELAGGFGGLSAAGALATGDAALAADVAASSSAIGADIAAGGTGAVGAGGAGAVAANPGLWASSGASTALPLAAAGFATAAALNQLLGTGKGDKTGALMGKFLEAAGGGQPNFFGHMITGYTLPNGRYVSNAQIEQLTKYWSDGDQQGMESYYNSMPQAKQPK